MNAEFEDETGVRRTMTRDELLTCIGLLAAAGSDTTGRLFGWCGKVLADHPDQRRQLAADPSLIPKAIEEVLRYEPPALQTCRYVARDTEHYGQVVPEGSAMLFMFAAANRDPRRHENPDVFDIHRKTSHMSLGFGPHFCIGAPLARLETRVVLEEVLKRFPEWEVDTDRAKPHLSSEVRGWERLPVTAP
jgi:cytochrome P450